MTETKAERMARIRRERIAPWLSEHRRTGGKHYGLNGPDSSAAIHCPRCNGGKS